MQQRPARLPAPTGESSVDESDQVRERIAAMLRSSAVFGPLSDALRLALAAAMRLHTVPGGSPLFHEGEPADSMAVLLSGGLRAWRRSAAGELLLYNQFHPGQSVGELAMILQQARAQHVTALRDSLVALLDRRSYEALLLQHPLELNRVMIKTVADRLRNQAEGGERRLAQTYLVLPLAPDDGTRQAAAGLARQLSAALQRLGRTGHLRQRGPGLDIVLNEQPCPRERLAELDDGHDYLVYEADAQAGDWTLHAFRHADQLVLVARAGADARLSGIEAQLQRETGWSLKRQHLALLHPVSAPEAEAPEPWTRERQLERIYPLRDGHDEDVARLARFLTGQAVGLVLGGGGARGFAHLGVLRALREAGVPVDLIGGNSMGALIGAQLAQGHDLATVLAQTRGFAAGGERLTLPLVSLVGGRRIERDLRALFGEQQIERLWRPFFAASCNLSRGSTTVLDRGPLWRAVLASNSPAGLLPPVLHDGDLLVDGAILENVPVQAMRMRLGTPLERRRGNGQIIAIDVDARAELRADPQLHRLSPGSRLRSLMRRSAPAVPGIADILYAAGHVGGASQRGRTIAQADVYLQPDLSHYALMAYARAQEIADEGYRHALQQIEQWQDLAPPSRPR